MWRISRAMDCAWSRAFCSRQLAALLMLALFAATGAPTACAQSGVGHMPTLGGHVFVPTTFIPDPFINTQIGFGLGYSNSLSTDVPLFTQGGQQIATVKGDLLFMTGGLDFSYAMRDWIGFAVRFNALARAGSNTASIFASGISAGSGFGLDWEFRLRQTERSLLSASAGIDRTAITLINVPAFVADPSVGLSRTYTPLLGSATLRYAYALNDQVGLSAFFTGGAGENPKDDYRSDGFYKLGAVVSINLEPRHQLPLGLSFGARTSSYPLTFDRVSGNTWDALFSFAYMGRPDLALTVNTMYEYVPIDYHDVTINYFGFTAGLQYFF
jgi:hypothetical protein